MGSIKPEYLAREQKYWMRYDAYKFIRPDWRRHVKPGSELAAIYEIYERKYRPDQARVPSGSRDGGQWTDEGGGAGGGSSKPSNGEPSTGNGRNDPRVLSDATPDNYHKPGVQVAARISQARAEECELQRRKDEFICKAFRSEPCYGQAMLRYSNCLQGRPIPPLNF